MQSHERIVCPACSQPSADFLFSAKDYNKRISDVDFLIYRCQRCDYVFVRNIPEDLGRYYPKEYYPIPKDEAELAERASMERYKIDLLTPFVKSGRLLEIGPAFGNFAYLAKKQGFSVQCIEMSPECCQFLREVVKVDDVIQSSDVARGLEQVRSFDVIALWHVLEHLPDPWTTLKQLADHIPSGGHLLLAMPNPKSIQFRVLGHRWAHLDAPRHLCLISPALLKQKLEALGFKAEMETASDPGGIGWNSFGWQVTLISLFSNRLLRFAGKVLGKLISIAIGPIERRGLNGACYTVIYRKS